MSVFKKAMRPIVQRLQLMIGRCVLNAAEAKGLLTMQVEALEGETIEGAERIENYGLAGHPPGGAEGVSLAIGGARDHIVIVCMEHRGIRPEIKDGEVKVYSIYEQFIHLDEEGFMVFEAPKGFKFKGEIFQAKIDKSISFDGQTFDATLKDSIAFDSTDFNVKASNNIGMTASSDIGLKASYFGVAAAEGSHIEGGLEATEDIKTRKNFKADQSIQAAQDIQAGGQVKDNKSTMQDIRNIYNGHAHPGVGPTDSQM